MFFLIIGEDLLLESSNVPNLKQLKPSKRNVYGRGQVSVVSGSGYLPFARLPGIKLNPALASRPKTLSCQQGFNSLPDGQQQVVIATNLALTIQAKSRNYASALFLGMAI